jgi:hypothetical protein
MQETHKKPFKILQSLKVNYPSQHSKYGSITVKILLCSYTEPQGLFCVMGEGENDWLIKNGRSLKFSEVTKFFSGLEEIRHLWIGPEEEEEINEAESENS